MLKTELLDSPDGVRARLGWDPGTSVHDRRRLIAKELIGERLGCEPHEVQVDREDPRGFGYHTRLIASRNGQELPIAIITASFRAATVVAICDPQLRVGIDLRDSDPDEADLRQMKRHSHLLDLNDTADLVQHWTRVQAVLEADGRSARVAAENVRLDSGRNKGWIPDRKQQYSLTDASRDGWLISIALGIPPAA
ncbi:hypothetical protein [Microbacterium sp.]|uniref:hypothetical protein n=1 Tax=Microbacterium sp. TaxID=51671 RepID=UPI003A878A6A